MSGKQSKKSSRLRKPAIQEDLPLPPPPGPPLPAPEIDLAWWQKPATAATVALLAVLACVVAALAQVSAHRDRALAAALETRVKTLTLRAASSQRALRIAPNPRSWSAEPDATIAWPEPPELLDLYLPIGYAQFPTYAVTIDKVDQGRMMILQRVMPDSNREIRLSLNSSAFGRGEYRIRIEGYTWRGGARGCGVGKVGGSVGRVTRSLRANVVGGLFGSVLAREEDMLAWTEPNRPPDRPRLSETDNGDIHRFR